MIYLQPFLPHDFDRFIHWVHSAEDVMQFAGPSLQYPITTEQLQKYLLMPNRVAYVVHFNDVPIGHCAITDISPANAVLNHILIGDIANRNKRYGSLIVQEMLKIIFKQMNKQVAELYVFDWNSIAINCYKKIGFIHNTANTKIRIVNEKTWLAINMQLDAKHYTGIL